MSGFGDFAARVGLALGLGRIVATRTDRGKGRATLVAQVKTTLGETRDDLPVLSLYGVTSRPRTDADATILFMGGNRGSGLVVATGDGRFTVELGEGEVALHTHEGTKVHLRVGQPLLIEAPNGVTITSPTLTHNGRNIGADHKHSGVQAGSAQTGEPIP